MFFENEKENISKANDLEITDSDGSVSWDAILDDNAGKKPKKSSKKSSKSQAPAVDDLGIDLDLESFADDDTEVDEDELARILNEDSDISLDMPSKEPAKPAKASKAKTPKAPKKQAEPEPQVRAESTEALKSANINKTLSRYAESKKSGSNLLLLLLLLIVVVAGVGYFAYSYLSENGLDAIGDLISGGGKNVQQEAVAQDDIPVINEDETDAEELQEEKQEVVNVIPTGRDNPFLPLPKYIAMTNFNPEVDYDRLGIPRPPKDYGEQLDTNKKLMSITVTGIMYDAQKPSAIISYEGNDYFVQKGDKLDDFKVVDIGRSFVKIAYNKNIYKANVGETFGDFYGNTSMGGSSRHYYSSEDVYKNRNAHLRKYTADSDVVINSNPNPSSNMAPPAGQPMDPMGPMPPMGPDANMR